MRRTGIPALVASIFLVACGSDLPDTGSLRALDFTAGLSLGNDFSFSISPSGSLAVLIDREPETGNLDSVTFRVVDLVEGTSVTSCPEASFTAAMMTSYAWLDEVVAIPRSTMRAGMRMWDPSEGYWTSQNINSLRVSCSDCDAYDHAVLASRLIVPGQTFPSSLARLSIRSIDSKLQVITHGGLYLPGDSSQLMLVQIEHGEIGSTSELSSHDSVFEDIHVLRARLDPTFQYVAYTLNRKRKGLVPWPSGRDDVWLLSMRSKKRRLLGSLQLTTNLMWSPDSSRLYVAGRESYGAPGRLWVYELGQVDGE